jgi:ubiquitin C-terminal hydrolase
MPPGSPGFNQTSRALDFSGITTSGSSSSSSSGSSSSSSSINSVSTTITTTTTTTDGKMMPLIPENDEAFKTSVYAALRRFILCVLNGSPKPVTAPDIFKRAFFAGRPEVEFKENYMQDCAEFLDRLLAILADRGQNITNKVGHLFTGLQQSLLICKKCNLTSPKDDIITVWNLEIGVQTTVKAAFEATLKLENLPAGDFSCVDCKEKTSHEKSITIVEPSPVLVLHLKRFSCTESGKSKKIINKLEFDETLAVVVQNVTYEYSLYSFVVHRGPTMTRGHYYTFFKIGEQWIKADDKPPSLTNVTWKQCANEQAYLLLYELKSTVDEDDENQRRLSESLLSRTPRMLINSNVDCYWNSVLWALSRTKSLVKLLQLDPEQDKAHTEKINQERKSKVCYL